MQNIPKGYGGIFLTFMKIFKIMKEINLSITHFVLKVVYLHRYHIQRNRLLLLFDTLLYS